jgi:hypothetical protein
MQYRFLPNKISKDLNMKYSGFQDESPFAGVWFLFKVFLVLVLLIASPIIFLEVTKAIKRHHNISNIIARNDVELFYEKVADNHESLKRIDGYDVWKASRSNAPDMACDVMGIYASKGIELNDFQIDFIFEDKKPEIQHCIDQYYVADNIVEFKLGELFYHIDEDLSEEKIKWAIEQGFNLNTQLTVEAERDFSPTDINYLVGHRYHFDRTEERCNHKGCYGARLVKKPIIKTIPIPSHMRVADVVEMARQTSGVSIGYSKYQKIKYFPLERAIQKRDFKLVDLYLDNGAQLTPGTETQLLQGIEDESVYRRILLRGKSWSDKQRLLVRSDIDEIQRFDWQDLVNRFDGERALLEFSAEYSSTEVFRYTLNQSDPDSIDKDALLKKALASIRPWNLEALLVSGWYDDIELTKKEFNEFIGLKPTVLAAVFKSEMDIKDSEKTKSLISWLSSHASNLDKFSHQYILDAYRKNWTDTQRMVVAGSIDELEQLIRRQPEALNQLDIEGNNPLMLALNYSLNDTADYLLETGAFSEGKNNLALQNSSGMDALTIASINGNLEMVQKLLDMNVPIQLDSGQCSPALKAVHFMNRKFAKVSKYISPFDRGLSPQTKTFLPNLLEIEHMLKAEYSSAGCFAQNAESNQNASSNQNARS